MADVDIRWTCIKHIVDLARQRPKLDGVRVEPGWPGDQEVTNQMIWADRDEGEVAIPVMTAGRKQRDDQFDVYWEFRVAGLADLDATRQRLSEMQAAFEDTFAEASTLEDLDGVVSAELTGKRAQVFRTPEGCIGFAEVVSRIHSRLL